MWNLSWRHFQKCKRRDQEQSSAWKQRRLHNTKQKSDRRVRGGLSSVRHNKHPAKRKQHLALIVGRICFLKTFHAHLFKQLALLLVCQALKIGAHASAVYPVKDCFRTVHYVLVLSLPDVNTAGMFAQHVIVESRGLHGKG